MPYPTGAGGRHAAVAGVDFIAPDRGPWHKTGIRTVTRFTRPAVAVEGCKILHGPLMISQISDSTFTSARGGPGQIVRLFGGNFPCDLVLGKFNRWIDRPILDN